MKTIFYRLCVLFAVVSLAGCVSVFSADEGGFVEGQTDTTPPDTTQTDTNQTDTTTALDTSGSGDTATHPDTEDPPDTPDTSEPPDTSDTTDTALDPCEDNTLNGSETDLDCGGDCAPCANYRYCQANDDCQSQVCTDGLCQPPTCLDTTHNGQETDQDCGGPNCTPCALSLACQQHDDCLSGFCLLGLCTAPTCEDALRNGGESDVDCGGPNCTPCSIGQVCNDNPDCKSEVCGTDSLCQPESCTDNTQNGSETDQDCGGPACAPCGDRDSCLVPSDCQSSVCDAANVCAAPSCTDALLNGSETDQDCGGPCPACNVGQTCNNNIDCESGLCDANTCVDASCLDLLKNGSETDVDCGGPSCAPCDLGKVCMGHADCLSNRCQNSICSNPVCGDGLVGPTEECDDNNTTNSDACVNCVNATCGDGFRYVGVEACDDGNQENTDDCLRTCVQATCGDGFVHEDIEQCDDQNPTDVDLCNNTCHLTTCTDNIRNADESDIDCGGRCGPGLCALGRSCAQHSDCTQGICNGGTCDLAKSCQDLLNAGFGTSGVYTLDVDGYFGGKAPFQAYCEQLLNGGGWTLALRINGQTGTNNFRYSNSRWTNLSTVNEGIPGVSRLEGKFRSAIDMPLSEIMIGFEYPIQTEAAPFNLRTAVLDIPDQSSLVNLFSNQGQPTLLPAPTRSEWLALIPGALLPPSTTACDRIGINLNFGSYARLRIGILTAKQSTCNYGSDYSWIGAGADNDGCASMGDINTGANGCGDNGTPQALFPTFTAIFIR